MNKGDNRRRHSQRCAIYTRKSSEEGLEQEFNSLHAQREACEAFIKSQRHEGWVCLPQAYDDGGRSGGNLERATLQQLLADIRGGKVDVVVVVYKIDRPTRSLADFAKIVETFDNKGVSFVSVTQQFNTTTSMGRLTLNVLLSFAQFEREVTGERIRDKIAASKKKGMWMGGVPPLGYAVQDRKLIIVEPEAEAVRHIFHGYLTLGSVRLLKQELEAQGITGKRWVSSAGRVWGGKAIGRGALYTMLQNRIYRGEVVHQGQAYPGEHAPIVDQQVWDAVQGQLAGNTAASRIGGRIKSSSLLTGLIFDSDGNRMTPTHAVKHGIRYRYYVSRPLIVEGKTAPQRGLRIPAAEIEQIVTDRLCRLLSEPASVLEMIEQAIADPAAQHRLIATADELAHSWSKLSPLRVRVILLTLVQRIEVRGDGIEIRLLPSRLAAVLDNRPGPRDTLADGSTETPVKTIFIPGELCRAGKEVRMMLDPVGPIAPSQAPDPVLVRAILKAHRFNDRLVQGRLRAFGDLARGEKLHRFYLTQLLRLAYLAPDITAAILDGRQPPRLTATQLIEHPNLPLSWAEQRKTLGFPNPT